MPPIFAVELAASALPGDFLFWCAASSLISAIAGFAGGYQYARTLTRRSLEKAAHKVSQLYTVVLETLDSAQEACSLLEKFPHLKLSSDQTQRLNHKRTCLAETVAGIVDSQLELQEESSAKTKPEDLNINWTRSPEDLVTGLPNREAFDSNLNTFLELGNEYEIQHGLLLVKIDKYDHLKTRFESHRAEKLLKKMASIVCLSLRDEDLACRFNTETFGILMPDVNTETGRIFCEKIRERVRNHHFRLDEEGQEVLVTASFGFTACDPGDNAELVLNRAGNALSKSQRRGRNQLHVHDGNSLALCSAR